MRLLLLLLLTSTGLSAQYLFEGTAPEAFRGAYVYLDILDHWDDPRTISDQMPLQRSLVDSNGYYRLTGNELPAARGFYRLRFGKLKEPAVFMNFAIRHYVHFVASPGDSLQFSELALNAPNPVNQTIARVSEQLDALAQEELAAETERLPALINEKRIRLLKDELKSAAPVAAIFLAGCWPEEGPPLPVLLDLEKKVEKEPDLRPTYLASLRARIGELDAGQLRGTTRLLKWLLGLSLALNAILLYAWWRAQSRASTTATNPAPVLPELTAKEEEVLSLIGVGQSNKEIASTLFISAATVKTHINSIYRKAGIRSRKEARALWEQLKNPIS